MEQHWVIKNNNHKLAVFVLGWSCDVHSVAHLKPEGFDILCIYDYQELKNINTDEFNHYDYKILIGWSFGVWVATQIFKDDTFNLRIAINGTTHPIDDDKGIPQRVAQLTLRALELSGIEQFNVNTYGSLYKTHPEIIPTRNIDNQIRELEKLYEMIDTMPHRDFKWDRAIIGSKDRIFPVTNQKRHWGETAIITESPHYPFFDSIILKTIFEQ